MKKNILYTFKNMQCFYGANEAPREKDFCGLHSHEEYNLLFFYDGDVDFTTGENSYPLQKNDLLLVKPNFSHRLQPHSSRCFKRVILTFREEVLSDDLLPILQNANSLYHLEANSPIKRIFDNLLESLEVFSEEDLEYLRRVADMEWKKEFTTASIVVDMTNNNQINGDSDLDGIVTRLADKLYEEMNVVANGVYAY